MFAGLVNMPLLVLFAYKFPLLVAILVRVLGKRSLLNSRSTPTSGFDQPILIAVQKYRISDSLSTVFLLKDTVRIMN